MKNIVAKNLTITADKIENNKIITKGKLNIDSQEIKNIGKLYSGKDMSITTKNIENQSEISSSGK